MIKQFIAMHDPNLYKKYLTHAEWIESTDAVSMKLTYYQKDWLLDEGSLTNKLKNITEHFSVELIREKLKRAVDNVKNDLTRINSEYIIRESNHIVKDYIEREVWLKDGQNYLIYAITQIPRTTYQSLPSLSGLQSKPLGEVIFQIPIICKERSWTLGEWPARKSLYYLLGNKPILVTELFLDRERFKL